jgi:hypothetical protein
MDYQKLDAPLASALTDQQEAEDQTWEVFIHTQHVPSASEEAHLRRLGVAGDIQNTIVTARLSKQAIDELTNQPWIRVLKLSQKLRPLTK